MPLMEGWYSGTYATSWCDSAMRSRLWETLLEELDSGRRISRSASITGVRVMVDKAG